MWLVGSVTTKVLHRGSSHVIVVPIAKSSKRKQKIATAIVPLDGSINAEQTLPHVISLAKSMELKVVIAQVVPAPSIYEGLSDVSKAGVLTLLEDQKERSKVYLDKVESRLRKTGNFKQLQKHSDGLSIKRDFRTRG